MTEAAGNGEDLLALFLAALEAVAPEVTPEQRGLVREVVNGMAREQTDPFGEAEITKPRR